MAYNTGEFSLFKFSTTTSQIVANLRAPTFRPTGSVGSLVGSYIAPTITVTGAAKVTNVYSEAASMTITQAGSNVQLAASVNMSGPNLFSGRITNAYSLYVISGSGAGTIQNNFAAYFDPVVGFGTTTPMSSLDVAGAVAVGTYAGNVTAPLNGMIISGSLGVANPTPSYRVDVLGQAGATHIYSPQTTQWSQLFQLAEGWDQGYGSGVVGSQLTVNSIAVALFDLATLGNISIGGGIFDGRYLYFIPSIANPLTRYDVNQAFSSSASYSNFTISSLNSQSSTFNGGAFDGQYVYCVPGATLSGLVVRYNTNALFSISSSYSIFNTQAVQSNSVNFAGSVFDGRYIYYVPGAGALTASGQITRYDTTLPFTSASSYSFFDMASAQSNSTGFASGVFDGRYVYFTPQINRTGTYFGQISSYDTTLPFTSASSYRFFNTQAINTLSKGFAGQGFDGRFIYFMNLNGGQITRYDTTLTFTNSLSYNFFNTTSLQSNSTGFSAGCAFDGRYVYFAPGFNFVTSTWHGRMTRYDVTGLFSSSTSYSFFDIGSVQSLYVGFSGAIYDGRYVYFLPNFNGVTLSGKMARINAYGGTALQAQSTWGAPNGLTMLGGGAISLSNVTTVTTASAGAGASTSQVQGYLVLNINGTSRKIPFYGN